MGHYIGDGSRGRKRYLQETADVLICRALCCLYTFCVEIYRVLLSVVSVSVVFPLTKMHNVIVFQEAVLLSHVDTVLHTDMFHTGE
jgi:hypothetical protein